MFRESSYDALSENSKLIKAIQEDNIIELKKAIKNGAEINRFGGLAGNPLELAIHKQNIDVVRTLLEFGLANPNLSDFRSRNSSPFSASLKPNYSTDIVRLLLEYGANPNNRDDTRENVEILYENADNAKIQLLVDYGLKLNNYMFSEEGLAKSKLSKETKDLIRREKLGLGLLWRARRDAVNLYEGTNGDEGIGIEDDHISRYLLNPLVFKEIMTYHQPTGGRKKTKKARKSRRMRKRRTMRK